MIYKNGPKNLIYITNCYCIKKNFGIFFSKFGNNCLQIIIINVQCTCDNIMTVAVIIMTHKFFEIHLS